jgi:hypothetical protein
MHAKNFCSEFLDIFKNDFRPAGAYAPMSQSEFPHTLGHVCTMLTPSVTFFIVTISPFIFQAHDLTYDRNQ